MKLRNNFAIIFRSLLLLTFASALVSCKSFQTGEDIDLTKRLTGNWRAEDRESIIFFDYGKFIDSLFIEVPHVADVFIPEFIFEGKFIVINSEIIFSEVKVIYSKAAETTPDISFHRMINRRTISFVDNELFLQEIQKFYPKQSYEKIANGKWECGNSAVVFQSDKNSFSFMNAKISFSFNDAEKTCERKLEFENDYSEADVHSSFEYHSNRINFTALKDVMALFKDAYWLWFIDDPIRFIKQQ